MVEKGVDIAPAEGKLGILLVGLGAVSTTLVAGVEAIKRGISQPVGSLTQMGTIRLGKRTDNRTPKIKDFVPLASLDDIVFGAWDIFHDSALRRRDERRRSRQGPAQSGFRTARIAQADARRF